MNEPRRSRTQMMPYCSSLPLALRTIWLGRSKHGYGDIPNQSSVSNGSEQEGSDRGVDTAPSAQTKGDPIRRDVA